MATAKRTRPRPTTTPVEEVVTTEVSKPKKTPVRRKKPIAVKPRQSAKDIAAKARAEKAKKRPNNTKTSTGRAFNEHGFVVGSDSAIIVDAMLEGGPSRLVVNEKAEREIAKTNGLVTRSGKHKNVPSLGSAILRRLLERGYTVEERWVVLPPAGSEAAEGDSVASEGDDE